MGQREGSPFRFPTNFASLPKRTSEKTQQRLSKIGACLEVANQSPHRSGLPVELIYWFVSYAGVVAVVAPSG
jgi:hypothetical protein